MGRGRRDRQRAHKRALATGDGEDSSAPPRPMGEPGSPGRPVCELSAEMASHEHEMARHSTTAVKQTTLAQLMAARARVPPLDPTVPTINLNKTALCGPMPALSAARLLDALPPVVDGELWRARTRARQTLLGLLVRPSSEGHKVAFFVDGETPAVEPIELFPPRLTLSTPPLLKPRDPSTRLFCCLTTRHSVCIFSAHHGRWATGLLFDDDCTARCGRGAA